jgi:hypothetical protein
MELFSRKSKERMASIAEARGWMLSLILEVYMKKDSIALERCHPVYEKFSCGISKNNYVNSSKKCHQTKT